MDPRNPYHQNSRALARSAQSWSSYSGYFRESSELRPTRSLHCITHGNFSSHVLCLPTAERYRYFRCHFSGRVPERVHVRRYGKKHLPEYHGGWTAPDSIRTQAGAKLSKEWSAAVGIHRGEMPSRKFPMPLTARAHTQSIHGILGDLRAFSGVFDLVVANMTSASRDIVEYVIRPTL